MIPKFKYEDKVKFNVTRQNEKLEKHGVVYIIDRGGTWDNGNREPSYDIFVESENMLYKHVTESSVEVDV